MHFPRRAWLLVMIAVALTGGALLPAMAVADGDPASDVLLGQSVFYPYSPAVSPAIQKSLDTETATASRGHFPIKVALIASPVDLGVIPDLFGKPQKYADFLDQEISFQARRPLLVVMASGYGVQGVSGPGGKAVASLRKPAGGQTNDLARAAIIAVAKLAEATGHPLKAVPGVPGAGRAGTSAGSTTPILVGLVLAALAAAITLAGIRRRQSASR